ncbi:amidohydrolase family protein [Pseudorhodoplanes sp.]|uniref:amidohydrolase family protein n=1 Tax=Pseudorhodoplanes sp. TaxID=1934341 RepID=UPI002BFBF13D|nr:amidohydrolase family protein [Pseudorhodoplanes sp.]HWV54155.1 amidohydrolase family protein [Pseudorhodoplanes sp.]
MKRIALEEHFLAPEFEQYWLKTVEDVDPALYGQVLARLNDFGEQRLAAMDTSGIGIAVLSLAGPGVQIERDTATATRMARKANDFLATQMQKSPARYRGFAHLAVQDAKAAADELERCVRDLTFSGAMINGHTNGQYLDHPDTYPLWERAEALGVPLYLHPADPVTPAPALDGHRGLKRATWEWTMETGTHALRIVFSGLFDRFPRAKLALGHLGETLPYQLWRFDSRAKLYGVKLKKRPSDYIRENIVVTTSGMFSFEPIDCALKALGRENVMYSADYPFENPVEAGAFMDELPLDPHVLADISYNNAARLLRIGEPS